MAFFDKINSIAKNVGDKTGDAIEMAKINARIASERSAMNDIYRQLGEAYYAHRINGGEGEPAEAAAIYSQLDQRTAAIDEAQKQIVAIKAEGERRAAEAAAAEEAACGQNADEGAARHSRVQYRYARAGAESGMPSMRRRP